MKIFAREGDLLFATLTPEEFDVLDSFRTLFAQKDEHRRGIAIGAEVNLVAWVTAAGIVSKRREPFEAFADILRRTIARLDESHIGTPSFDRSMLTLADIEQTFASIEHWSATMRNFRATCGHELIALRAILDEIGPPDLKT